MKKLMILLLVCFSASAFASDLAWETDFDKAKEVAARENKTILINFTGSDWCGWCKRLDREVFNKDEFAQFANDNLVLLKVDFPKYTSLSESQQEANDQLASKYNVRGFPSIFLVDATGNIKLSTGYRRGGAEPYIAHLKAKL